MNNWIGLNGAGLAMGNQYGVLLNDVTGNTIGGAARVAGQLNVISANAQYGVWILGGSGDFVQNNRIGTNPDGAAAVSNPNQSVGVLISNSLSNQVMSNLVSGNGTYGIEIFGSQSTGNVVGNNTSGPTRGTDSHP